MSFSFSQSLLNELPYSHTVQAGGSISQELDNSQDSGYSAATGNNNFYPRINTAAPSFPTRRTLPRPPTWPTTNIQKQPQHRINSRWYFGGGRQEMKEGRSALERDLQQHLKELSNQTMKVPGKLSKVVEEAVKYIQDVYSLEGQDGKQELLKLESTLHGLKQQIKNEEKNAGIADLNTLGTVLSKCERISKTVTEGRERNKTSFLRLQDKIKTYTATQLKLKDAVEKFTFEDINALKRKVGTEMTDRNQRGFTPSSRRQVSANRLPSIRRLPTLPLGGSVPAKAHQGNVVGSRMKMANFGRRTVRLRVFMDDMEE